MARETRNPLRGIDPTIGWAALVLAAGVALLSLYGCGVFRAAEGTADETTLLIRAVKETVEQASHLLFEHLPIFFAGYFVGRPIEAVVKRVHRKAQVVKRVKGWLNGRKKKKASNGGGTD